MTFDKIQDQFMIKEHIYQKWICDKTSQEIWLEGIPSIY